MAHLRKVSTILHIQRYNSVTKSLVLTLTLIPVTEGGGDPPKPTYS